MRRLTLRFTLFPYTTLFRSYQITYMTSLMFETLIKYYEHFSADKRIPDAMGKTLDWQWDHERIAAEHTFVYLDLTGRSEEHTSELQPPDHVVCRLLLGKKGE